VSTGNGKLLLPALLAFVALAGLSLGACGGDDEADREAYAEQVQSALSALSAELRDLGDQLQNSDKAADLATGLDQARADLDETAAELEDLDVPDDLTEINEDLVTAIRNFSSNLGEIVGLAKSGGGQALQQATADLLALVAQLQSDINAVRQKADEAGLTLGTAEPTSPTPSE
jgi:chromosome segregation ATPase